MFKAGLINVAQVLILEKCDYMTLYGKGTLKMDLNGLLTQGLSWATWMSTV